MSHSPSSLSELTELVRQWHQDSTPWIPSGQGRHLHWGPPLNLNHSVLSCRQLKRVIDHAVDDLTITVEAGLELNALQALLAERKQWLPIDTPRDGQPSSIGGLVARGLAGGLRHRHLGVRDQIIGIGLMRSDGITAKAGGRVVKNVAGYDLMRLLCGSWGSLALITQLTLRLKPISPFSGLLIMRGTLEHQDRFRAALMQSSLTPDRCDWQQKGDGSWRLRLLINSINTQAVDDQLKLLEHLAERHDLIHERAESQQPYDTGMAPQTGQWLVRLVLPPANLHQLLSSEAMGRLPGWHWDLAAGSGCGDGWSTSVTPAPRVRELRQELTRLGGWLSVLQQPESSAIEAWLDAPARPLMEAVKRQFDPKLQLCRGRLPGVHQPTA